MTAPPQTKLVAQLNARIDRLPRTGLRLPVFVVIGLSYFFAFYEISTFAYTLPTMREVLGLAGSQVAFPVAANLAGYAVGSYLLGRIADRRGRRVAMMLTVAAVAVSATATALSWDVWSLTVFRFLSGVATGAEIILAATLISELSPAKKRGRYVMLNYLWGAAGLAATPFITIGLLGTGPIGWRLVYAVGAAAALLIFVMRGRYLPESPRWSVLNGREAEAQQLVASMEERCRTQLGRELPPVPEVAADRAQERGSVAELFRPPYLRRTVVALGFWFLMYVANYSYLSYFPAILIDAGLPEPSGLLYSGLGQLGLPIGALIALAVADRVERKHYLVVGTTLYAAGFVIVAVSSGAGQIIVGAALISIMFAACAVAYVYTSEIFPTRIRSTGSALGNGVGHLGGVISPFVAVALLDGLGGRATLWAMAAFVLAAALLLLWGGVRTSGRELTEIAN
ncbi:MFS transporter [Prauserella muralis]|uniref:MFS transporter n=1 Tax=Prauserella muralis TaxID=588067 RepID=UPI000DD4AC41|nr:MFS transporter [Prauserella muralis]TWE28803.1 putative MFS transporter [Prauserella muralis]